MYYIVLQIPDFYSTALKAKTVAKRTVRLRTFPDYLWIQLKKFAVAENWTPYKLDVEIKMPDDAPAPEFVPPCDEEVVKLYDKIWTRLQK